MKIAGLQKLTLLDFPGRCAATVFTPGCNLRCPFCHNASLVESEGTAIDKNGSNTELIDIDALLAFLKERYGRLTGLAVTGGEPLMQDNIADFLAGVKAIGYAVKLDTNGSYPDRLKKILDMGLADYVAMDVKNSFEKYGLTTGIGEHAEPLTERIKESMGLLQSSGVQHEFRTTVIAQLHTAEDMEKIAAAVGSSPFFIQCFKDSGDILRGGCNAPDNESLREFLERAKKIAPQTQLRGVDL